MLLFCSWWQRRDRRNRHSTINRPHRDRKEQVEHSKHSKHSPLSGVLSTVDMLGKLMPSNTWYCSGLPPKAFGKPGTTAAVVYTFVDSTVANWAVPINARFQYYRLDKSCHQIHPLTSDISCLANSRLPSRKLQCTTTLLNLWPPPPLQALEINTQNLDLCETLRSANS